MAVTRLRTSCVMHWLADGSSGLARHCGPSSSYQLTLVCQGGGGGEEEEEMPRC